MWVAFMRIFVFSLLLIVAGQGICQQKLYVTVDSHGVKHYSDQATVRAHEVYIHVDEPATPVADASSGKTSLSVEEKTPSKDWKDGEKPFEKMAPNHEEACKQFKSNVDILSNSSKPAVVYDAQGKEQQLSDEARDVALEEAKKNVKRYCP